MSPQVGVATGKLKGKCNNLDFRIHSALSVLFYVFVFRKNKHNKGLPGQVHLSFLTSLLERSQLGCDVISIYDEVNGTQH